MIDSMDKVPTGAECASTMMLSKRAPNPFTETHATIFYNILQDTVVYYNVRKYSTMYSALRLPRSWHGAWSAQSHGLRQGRSSSGYR